MAKFKNVALKMIVVGLSIGMGYAWVNQTPQHAQAFGEKVERLAAVTTEKAETALDKSEQWVDAKSTQANDAWEQVGLSEKTNALQDSVQPYGQSLKQTFNPNRIPGINAARWADKHTSFTALFFFLVAGLTIGFMAFASPSSVRHR